MRVALSVACFLALSTALAARAAVTPYLIETEFEPARAYVGAESVLRLRLLRAPGVPYGALRPPEFGDDAEVSPPIGYGRDYETERAGTLYSVRERSYLVIARRAGKFVLHGPELLGPLRQAQGIMHPVRGAPRVFEVHPARSEAGEPWLPARRVWLEESWSSDPASLAAGAVVVRTLTVRAVGLSGDRLPRLEMAAQPGLSVHHDANSFSSEYVDTGMAGRRAQRVVLMPLEEGALELPELRLRWWDIMADAPRVATLPARSLRVGPVAVAPAAQAPVEPPSTAVPRAFTVASLVVCALLLWAWLRRQPQRESRQRLRLACARGNAPAAREALLEWWAAAAPEEPAPLIQRMGDGWDERARAQLAALDAALYGGRAWDGKAFWRAVRPWLRGKTLARRRRAAALPPLFKLQARR